MGLVDRILFEKTAPLQTRHLARQDYSRVGALARAVLDQMDADFLIGPPLTVHMPNPELMAGVWSGARECLAAGREGRPLREVVAAMVSRLNGCPYCYDIHTSMLHSWGEPGMARAVWRREAFGDSQVQAVAEWASATLTPEAAVIANPPFSAEEAPAIIGTAMGFHYVNRIVNVFLDASPVPLKGNGWVKAQLIRMSGGILRPRLSRQTPKPGQFLVPLTGTLPVEFSWALGNRNIAAGFQRFAAAAEAAGEETVEPEVRAVVDEFLAKWRGEAPGIGRAWLDGAVSGLAAQHRPAARLGLLAAVASYQVDDGVVAEYRRERSGDRDLINLVAWSCYAAARRIGGWLKAPAAAVT